MSLIPGLIVPAFSLRRQQEKPERDQPLGHVLTGWLGYKEWMKWMTEEQKLGCWGTEFCKLRGTHCILSFRSGSQQNAGYCRGGREGLAPLCSASPPPVSHHGSLLCHRHLLSDSAINEHHQPTFLPWNCTTSRILAWNNHPPVPKHSCLLAHNTPKMGW